VRTFIMDKLKVASDLAYKIQFNRVHRIGNRITGSNRLIVAKFTLYNAREMVRREWKSLNGTGFYVKEQFPKSHARVFRKLGDVRPNGIFVYKQTV